MGISKNGDHFLDKVPGSIHAKSHYNLSIFKKYGIFGEVSPWGKGNWEIFEKLKKNILVNHPEITYSKFY